ncbi:SusC/RagA family TonB-linked outer membrane protein [Spirosoma aerolatum]|uniref:SusC/RagA family TonB-linked outer membrane protein n=1 Tax=Spirosoma aerolatum TaxID=1211326 RepID=UPI0009ADFB98|nr:TonB-dependent receptor [Spirosoma aerolatum]
MHNLSLYHYRAGLLGLALLLTLSQLLAQTSSSVSGRVTDEGGQPLPGVTVLVKNTNNGTTTNAEGVYKLSLPTGNTTLVVSYVGYLSQEVAVNGRSTIDVQLAPGDKTLNEVVVVGYGTQQKKDLTGAIATIGSRDIQKVPVSGFDQALKGQVAGLQITNTSGAPGGNTSVLIRGISSITGGNEPLYVIDGFPVNNAGFGNPLNTINPGDIESIDVLKDASATAIYGSRGSNGVIIITTKQGKSGKAKIEVNAYTGFQQVTRKIEMMNAQEYAAWVTEARNASYLDNVAGANINDPNSKRASSYQIPAIFQDPSKLTTTDWQDAIFRTAPIQNYQISASGGTDNFRYALSGSYFNQQGIIISSGLQRYTFRANLEGKLSDKVSIGVNLTPSYTDQNDVNAEGHYGALGILSAAQSMPPFVPVYNADGSYSSYIVVTEGQPSIANPVQIANEYKIHPSQFRILGNAFATYSILKDLKLRVTFGTDINQFKRRTWTPNTINPSNPSTAEARNGEDNSWLNENTLNYKRQFNDHTVDAIIGYTAQRSYSDLVIATAGNFPDNLIPNINGGTVTSGSESTQIYTLQSFLARVNYGYKDKYLITATLRRDGSSRFGANNRWGTFPSASVGWRVSEEGFMKGQSLVSDLKLRASYGLTGNNAIGNYRAIGQLSGANYVIGDVLTPGLGRSSFTNPELGWESTTQVDVGLDLSVLNSRLSFTADYYRKVNSNMLFTIQTPAVTGLTSAVVNLGKVENKGVELSMSSRNLVGAFKWNTNFNITFNRNKVLQMSTDAERILSASGGRPAYAVTQAGYPIGSFFGRRFLGIFRTEEEAKAYTVQPNAHAGDVKWKDIDGNGVINDNDKEVIGSPYPKYYFGFNNTFTYKGFSLDIMTSGQVGQQVYNNSFYLNNSGVQNNAQYVYDNRWVSPDQPGNGLFGRAIRGGKNDNTQYSSVYLFDASFWRIRNVTLAYALPNTLVNRLGLGGVRVYATATNLYTFTSYFGYDPETNISGDSFTSFGLDFGAYPQARTVTFGVNLSF